MEESNQNKCLHNNDKRERVGTYTTVEIQEAIKHGYTIVMIYDILDYKKQKKYDPANGTHGHFSKYITNFDKLKCQSSGFPKELQLEREKETYLKDLSHFDGVKLDKSEISDDAGVRTIAKYLCNSLWGYFVTRKW